MRITAESLHDAADIMGSFGDDESRIAEYGIPWEALKEFVDSSDWRDENEQGPLRDLDPLALAMGISIGVIAATKCDRQAEMLRQAIWGYFAMAGSRPAQAESLLRSALPEDYVPVGA